MAFRLRRRSSDSWMMALSVGIGHHLTVIPVVGHNPRQADAASLP
jgi:hypothetical protein